MRVARPACSRRRRATPQAPSSRPRTCRSAPAPRATRSPCRRARRAARSGAACSPRCASSVRSAHHAFPLRQVLYDTSKCTYEQLLNVFWRAARAALKLTRASLTQLRSRRVTRRHNINPTTPDQQFVDKGPQYRSAIFYHTPEQKAAAVRARHGSCGRVCCVCAPHLRPAPCAAAGGVARRAAEGRHLRRRRAAGHADRSRRHLLVRCACVSLPAASCADRATAAPRAPGPRRTTTRTTTRRRRSATACTAGCRGATRTSRASGASRRRRRTT